MESGVLFLVDLRAAKLVVLLARRNRLLWGSLVLLPGHGDAGCDAVDDNTESGERIKLPF